MLINILFITLLALLSSLACSVGLFIPLYIYPTADQGYYTTLLFIKEAHPNLDMIVIINPDTGVGTVLKAEYVPLISTLRAANITVLGYLNTEYTDYTIEQTEADILQYSVWYPELNGIFFDQMYYLSTGKEDYYRTAVEYARSLGYSFNAASPGQEIELSYIGITNITLIFQNTYLANQSNYDTYSNVDKYELAAIAYNQSSLNTTWLAEISKSIGYIYVSDLEENGFGTLPSYIGQLANILDDLTESTSTEIGSGTNTTSNETIQNDSSAPITIPVSKQDKKSILIKSAIICGSIVLGTLIIVEIVLVSLVHFLKKKKTNKVMPMEEKTPLKQDQAQGSSNNTLRKLSEEPAQGKADIESSPGNPSLLNEELVSNERATRVKARQRQRSMMLKT